MFRPPVESALEASIGVHRGCGAAPVSGQLPNSGSTGRRPSRRPRALWVPTADAMNCVHDRDHSVHDGPGFRARSSRQTDSTACPPRPPRWARALVLRRQLHSPSLSERHRSSSSAFCPSFRTQTAAESSQRRFHLEGQRDQPEGHCRNEHDRANKASPRQVEAEVVANPNPAQGDEHPESASEEIEWGTNGGVTDQ